MPVRTIVKNAVLSWFPGVLRRGPTTTRRVALTFDDGPDELTPEYLDLLDELRVPATFFVIGELALARPDLVREYLRRGHQIAGHGFDHTRFPRLSRRQLIDQCSRTDAAIGGQASGQSWVRPPHGALDARSLLALRAAGYIVALWSVDSCDYGERDPHKLAQLSTAAPGDVVLLHEGQRWTLDAVPQIVAAIHASGLECVTMHDLFAR